MRLGGLILAGGRSRRMGRPKEALPIAGTTMLARQCATLLACCDDVVVVGREPGQDLPEVPASVRFAHDAAPDQGPLAALEAGLAHLQDACGYEADDAAMATGCDQPYLGPDVVRWLRDRLGRADLVMPQALGRLQPLTAVYRIRVLPHVRALLTQGQRRPRELASVVPDAVLATEAELRSLDAELRFLRNVNHVDDYEAARRALEGEHRRP